MLGGRLSGRLRPTAGDAVFALVLGLVLWAGRTELLRDPGTFWHLRLGQDILATGSLPRVDTLTSTRAGTPWIDPFWLYDAGLAWLVGVGGWSAAVAATALILAGLYGALARGLVRDGFTPITAFLVALVAAGVGSHHFHVRPHVFTMVFVLVTLRLCRAFHLGTNRRSIWLIPVVVAVWANIHGGFLAGPGIVGVAAVGHALSGRLDRRRVGEVGVYLGVFVLCLLAPLVNPYGVEMYRHAFEILHGAKVTDLIDEYQPAMFGRGRAWPVEGIVMALVILPVLSRKRPAVYDLLHAVVWLHLGLTSIRHAPLFGLAVAPVLATWIDGTASWGLEERQGVVRRSVWPWLMGGLVGVAVAAGWLRAGPDPRFWPLEGLAALDRQPVGARLFHEQNWGGLIEARSRPTRRAYLDDRFELWGRGPILEYLAALEGGPGWDRLDGRERFELVWVRPGRDLARRLSADPGWEVVHRDAVSVLLRRAAGESAPRVATRGEGR